MATETNATKVVKKTAATKSAKKRESTASLKKRIAELEAQRDNALNDYGNAVAANANLSIQLDAMLGQILKALFIVGIGPDELMAKCQQIFRKKVVAD